MTSQTRPSRPLIELDANDTEDDKQATRLAMLLAKLRELKHPHTDDDGMTEVGQEIERCNNILSEADKAEHFFQP